MSALQESEKLFAFAPEDEWLADELRKLLRDVLQEKVLSPRQHVDFGLLLNAIERLPRVTPGTFLDFSLIYRFNDESTWTDLHIDDDAFRLGYGFSTYDPQLVGSDHRTDEALYVETGGYCSNPTDTPDVYHWFDKSRELLGLGCAVEISNDGERANIPWAEDDDEPFDWAALESEDDGDEEDEEAADEFVYDETLTDEEKYERAKPYFDEALAHFPDQDVKAAMNQLISTLQDEYGFSLEAIQAMRACVIRYVKEWRAEQSANDDQTDAEAPGRSQ